MSERITEHDVDWLARYRAGEVEDTDDCAPDLFRRARRVLDGDYTEQKIMWEIVALQTPEERRRSFERLMPPSAESSEMWKFLYKASQRTLAEQLEERRVTSAQIVGHRKGAGLQPHSKGFRIELGRELPDASRPIAVGHEAAHTFFFDWGPNGPTRGKRGSATSKLEELRCELFAYLWLEQDPLHDEMRELVKD